MSEPRYAIDAKHKALIEFVRAMRDLGATHVHLGDMSVTIHEKAVYQRKPTDGELLEAGRLHGIRMQQQVDEEADDAAEEFHSAGR